MTNFGDSFIQDISLLNPSVNVTDENANLPHLELLHNQQFLLNLLNNSSSNNSQLLSLIYGNILDYDSSGNKIFFNGGKFDCFEKKHSWLAINDGSVSNETDIQLEGASDLLVYKGGISYTDTNGSHGIWLERDFYIPTFLRGGELIFAIKGTGVYLNSLVPNVPFDSEIPYCDSSTITNVEFVGIPNCLSAGTTGTTGTGTSGTSGTGTSGTSATTGSPADGTCEPDLSTNCYARYEDVGIEIVGAVGTIQEVIVLGPWPHHDLYAKHDNWLPKYRTNILKFKVGKNTETIKIRIRRTKVDGAIAISNMFMGGLPHPFEEYNITNADINEFYDYINGITKWNVTTVNGRHVGNGCGNVLLPNLMTKQDWICLTQFVKNVDQLDWDQENGPRSVDLSFGADVPFSIPATHGLEFDPEFTRYAHFDMRVDGPDPGLSFMGITFAVSENEFSGTSACTSASDLDTICGYVKFDIWVKVVNTNDFANPSLIDYTRYTYNVPILSRYLQGGLGYFEMYGNFYEDLTSNRGSLVYFTISRDAENDADTFEGNLIILGTKIGIAVPPDDQPSAGEHEDLFIGEGQDCIN